MINGDNKYTGCMVKFLHTHTQNKQREQHIQTPVESGVIKTMIEKWNQHI